MHSRLYLLYILAILATMASCAKSTDDEQAPPSKTYRRTVVVYMAAHNSLGYYNATYESCAQSDSAEIAYGARLLPTERDNVLLFIDDDRPPRLYRYFRQDKRGHYQKVYQYPSDVDSTDPATLRDVLERVSRLYPSDSYGLVLWSHGSGWLPAAHTSTEARAFGIDVGAGGNMLDDAAAPGQTVHEMDLDQLASAITASGLRPDYILFDACAMQCIEVAYALRHATNYVVASPTTTPAVGLTYYEQIANGLFVTPTNDQTIRQIVDTHRHCVFDCDTVAKLYDKDDFTWSIIKTSELETLAAATASVYAKAMANPLSLRLNDRLDSYVSYELMGYPDFFDLSASFYHLLPTVDYASWRTYLDRAVIYFRASRHHSIGHIGFKFIYGATDLQNGCGVSMYIPQAKYTAAGLARYNQAYATTEWGRTMTSQ